MANPTENPGYVDSKVLQNLAQITGKLKQRIVELLQIKLGDRVLDVGCGPGTDTIPLAQLVGETGFVVGVDYDETMIKEADDRAKLAGVATWVRHELADASSIPYKSEFFDACRSERLFQHVADSTGVLKEMVRVTKADGRLAVADADWCTLSIDTLEIEIERRIVRFCADILSNGCAGRQLFRLFKDLCIKNVIVEINPMLWTDYEVFYATSFSLNDLRRKVVVSGIVSEEELQQFMVSLEDAHQRGVFFASGNIMIVAGVKAT